MAPGSLLDEPGWSGPFYPCPASKKEKACHPRSVLPKGIAPYSRARNGFAIRSFQPKRPNKGRRSTLPSLLLKLQQRPAAVKGRLSSPVESGSSEELVVVEARHLDRVAYLGRRVSSRRSAVLGAPGLTTPTCKVIPLPLITACTGGITPSGC